MKSIRTYFLVFILFVLISLLFFYKSSLKGYIPFPGDLLVGEYAPYNTNFYEGYMKGGVPNMAQGPDVLRQLFPWKNFVIENLKNLEIPFWNPYSLSGNPLMANFQSGSFYPLNIIFLILSFTDAWRVFIILIPILSSFFMYLFLREFGLKIPSSIFAGFVFAFSSYMVVWMEYGNVGHTFLWLPLILLISEKLIKKQNFKYALYATLISSIAFLSGYVQGYFYIVLIQVIYLVGRSILLKKLSFRLVIPFFICLILPLLLTSFQLIPTIELFKNSSRGSYSINQIDKLLNPLWYLITIFVPNFFGHPASRNHWFYGTYIERVSYFGLIPLILSLLALFNFKKRKEIVIFGGLFISSIFLSANLFFNKFLYLIPIPFISTTVPTRILSIFVFCGSILAGFGMEFLFEKASKKNIWVATFLIWIVILFSWFFVILIPFLFPSLSWTSNFSIAKRNLILPTFLLISFSIMLYLYFRLKWPSKIILIAIFALTFLDIFYFFIKITPFAPTEYVYPNTDVFKYLKANSGINRFWGYGSGGIENNFSTYEHIYSTNGYEPLHIKRYGELLSGSKNGKIANPLSGADANIEPGYGDIDLQQNKYRKSLLDLIGVKYILNKNDSLGTDYKQENVFSKEIYKLVWHKSPWQIYENMNAFPRIFLASDYIVESKKEKIIQMIFDKKFSLREKVILEENISPAINFAKDKNAKVEVEKYTPNKVVLRTNARTNMILFISDNYYPGWKVSIDKEFAKIYRANYSFRAVPIAKGNHEVIFSYRPESFNLGLKISLVTIAGLGLFIFVRRFVKNNV